MVKQKYPETPPGDQNDERETQKKQPTTANCDGSLGIEKLEPRAMLAAIANFNPATGVLSIDTNLTPVNIVRAKFGQILVNGQQVGTGVGTATNANTTRIAISSTPGFNDQVTLNLAQTGLTGFIEINGGGDQNTINGTQGSESIRVFDRDVVNGLGGDDSIIFSFQTPAVFSPDRFREEPVQTKFVIFRFLPVCRWNSLPILPGPIRFWKSKSVLPIKLLRLSTT